MQPWPRIDWYALRSGVELALRKSGLPPSTRVDGRIISLESGANHDNFILKLRGDEPSALLDERLLLRRIRSPANCSRYDETPAARLQKEAETLRALQELACPFDSPRFVCFVEDDDGFARAFIETIVAGTPLELLKRLDRDRHPRARMAIPAIARAAAAIHRLPVERFPFLRQHADADAHVADELSRLLEEPVAGGAALRHDPVALAALAWIDEHRPKQRPAAVLHGDLLPQNLLLSLETNRLSVVDWEYAQIGDPAYDLAIVTRGNRKPLGVEHGLRRLRDAYREAGGADVEPADVMVWEMLLVLSWLRDALQIHCSERHSGQPPEYYRNQLYGLLRRAPR